MTINRRNRRKSVKIAVLLAVLTLFCGNMFFPKTYHTCAASNSAVCVMEADTRRILYAENGDIRLPMASTTKVLTAITVLENARNLDAKIVVPKEAVGVEGSSIYLKEGDIYTVKDLLYGLMLRSGNDAATALAISVCPSVKEFCAKMNMTAQKAGARHSNFVNPHGLPNKKHYTTAIDLTLISCYAMQNPIFSEIVSTKYYEKRGWQNKNKLLTTYEGAIGVKTGYTKEAGRCLVASAEKNNMRLVCTILNKYEHYQTASKMLDDCFAAFKMHKIYGTGQTFEFNLGSHKIQGKLREDVYYPMQIGEEEQLAAEIIPYKQKNTDDSVGEIKISLAKRLIFSKKLYKL